MSTQTLTPGTTYPTVVGEVLVKLRERLRLKQGDLAAAVGVTQATWSRIENGSSALTIEQLGLAAEQLGKTPGEILQFADETSRQLESQGVRVEPQRSSGGVDSGIALIATAVIAGLIASIVLKK